MATNLNTYLMILVAAALVGCGSTSGRPELASDLSMNSSRTAKQLLTGFYQVENGAWRWTAKTFSVELGVPSGAATKGGKLSFRLVFPDIAAKTLHSVTLSATVGATSLPSATYSTPGEQTYTQEVPASALASSPVRVTFTLDKAMPPAEADIRELGVIANEISLSSK